MNTIYAIVILLVATLVVQFLNLYHVNVKSKKLFNTTKYFFNKQYFNSYKSKITSKLFILNEPYKLTFKKYCFIKFILSPLFIIIAYINYSNVFLPIILGSVIFFIPNYLIKKYEKNEAISMISDIRKINTSIVIYLSSHLPLHEALKQVAEDIEVKRFMGAFKQFVYDYETHGYDIEYAGNKLQMQFTSQELKAFLNNLTQSEREGNVLESLEKYSEVIELAYFKFIKKQQAKRITYVAVGTIVSLANIVLIVMYPIFTQVFKTLQQVFS